MKVKCIKDIAYEQITADGFRSITRGEILETDNSGTIECLRDFKSDLIISLDDENFYEYFEIIKEGMENKNIIKYEGGEFQDKKVEYGMIFETQYGLCMMIQTSSHRYELAGLETGNRIDDIDYFDMMISDMEAHYLGYSTITVSDFRKE